MRMPETDQQEIQQLIDGLVENARTAYREYLDMDQGQIDRIVQAAALAGVDRHMELARLALEETGRGIYEDKVIKNLFATEYIYHDIKYERTVGVIRDNEEEGYTEIAEPAGVIAALTPVTNPTSTTLFKGLIALKTRNPIIFSFHPSALRSSAASAEVLRDAAVKAGAPAHCIQWLTVPTKEASRALLHHPGVALILATGGEQMVRAAYSTGRPALGVGPGNVPCYIEQSANLRRAVNDLVLSKTFDNGMICASEQAVIVDRTVAREVRSLMEELGCYFAPPEEIPRLEALATCGEVCSLNPDVVGRSAVQIAEMAGITV
ncbi:MAG: aldehyde dehydrogenase family protein, partial [Clostridia bacterium]|nr:aldehyde dehydrogenase family protein [Clostridia bacterium]